MSNNRNKYEQAQKKKDALSAIAVAARTKGDAGASALETFKDIIVGTVAGGFTGAFVGRSSLLFGALAAGAGHYTGVRLLTSFGMGMMAAGGFSSKGGNTTEGLGFIDSAKERMKGFKDNLSQKLYLDKIIKKKEGEETSGVGEVKYFLYPGKEESKPVDLSALNMIENQVVKSAVEFNKESEGQTEGVESVSETLLDPTHRNY
jgi:hypothetical protein